MSFEWLSGGMIVPMKASRSACLATLALASVVTSACSLVFDSEGASLDASMIDATPPDALVITNRCLATEQADIPEVECQTLLELYDSTNGPDWINQAGWAEQSVTPCSWEGVTCAGGNVTEIRFVENNLAGPLPPSIGNFPELRSLRLIKNPLSGEIPTGIGSLTKLRELHLSESNILANTGLTGPLPSSIGDLQLLERLIIEKGAVNGSIPSSFGTLIHLRSLELDQNLLDGSPDPLAPLTQLENLELNGNGFSGPLPAFLPTFEKLTNLELQDNGFSGSIENYSFGGLKELTNLRLDNNDFTGSIPDGIGQLTKLLVVDLSDNGFSGEITGKLADLMFLDQLLLHNNALVGPVPDIEQLPITLLTLYGNECLTVIDIDDLAWICPLDASFDDGCTIGGACLVP